MTGATMGPYSRSRLEAEADRINRDLNEARKDADDLERRAEAKRNLVRDLLDRQRDVQATLNLGRPPKPSDLPGLHFKGSGMTAEEVADSVARKARRAVQP